MGTFVPSGANFVEPEEDTVTNGETGKLEITLAFILNTPSLKIFVIVQRLDIYKTKESL